jgi:glucose-6-phosphate 1-dehydrogenase
VADPSASSRVDRVIASLIIFGASGDLAGRFLLPALATLQASGRLAEDFTIVGTAREPWDDAAFRRHGTECLVANAGDVPREHRDALTRSLRYQPADLADAHEVATVVGRAGDGPVAAYLALPPGLFAAAVTALGAAGLPTGSRIALEKPFGESLAEAVALNATLADTIGDAGEQAVFRVDHVLGMATVRNLLALRCRDALLGAVWDSAHIEQVEVRWEEDLALEGRAGYYDDAGALKDVMQNHMLQVLTLLAMEPPEGPGERELRDAKVAVLRAARAPTKRTRRARYGAGRIGDRAVPAYVDEEGVDPARGTETFAEMMLELDMTRWRDTRFVLRAGKALRARRKEAIVRFRADAPGRTPEELRIGIDGPRDIALRLNGAAPITLTGTPPAPDVPPYGCVLLDLLEGGSTLAVRGDGAEEAWRVVEPVLTAWRDGLVPLEEYPAGSDGPDGTLERT